MPNAGWSRVIQSPLIVRVAFLGPVSGRFQTRFFVNVYGLDLGAITRSRESSNICGPYRSTQGLNGNMWSQDIQFSLSRGLGRAVSSSHSVATLQRYAPGFTWQEWSGSSVIGTKSIMIRCTMPRPRYSTSCHFVELAKAASSLRRWLPRRLTQKSGMVEQEDLTYR